MTAVCGGCVCGGSVCCGSVCGGSVCGSFPLIHLAALVVRGSSM